MFSFYHELMNVISWILFGIIVGIIAHAVDPRSSQGGLLRTVFLGIAGALVGGLLANVLLGTTLDRFTISSFLVAIVGSLVLLFVGNSFKRA